MKIHKQLLSFFLSALLLCQIPETAVYASVSDNSTDPSDNSFTVSSNDFNVNDEIDTDLYSDTAENNQVTLTFYDSDSQTILMQIPLPYQGSAVHISDVYNTYDFLKPVRSGYQVSAWNCITNGKTYSKASTLYSLSIKRNLEFSAIWKTTPYNFQINYETNGGTICNTDANGDSIEIPDSFRVTDDPIQLPDASRKNYLFAGWYKDAAMTSQLNQIATGTYIDSDESGAVMPLTLYAKWIDARPVAPTLLSAQNTTTGKVNLIYTASSGADGYEISYTTDKNFQKNVNIETVTDRTNYTVTNLPKGKTYYFRVRSYSTDSTDTVCYSEDSNILSCKITKGVKEYKAQKNAGKLKKAEIKDGQLFIRATVPKRLKSSDDFYYLVKVDPSTGKYGKKIADCPKLTKLSFSLPLTDENSTHLIQGKYALAVKKGKSYFIISNSAFVKNPEAAAAYTADFPVTTSKKGLQGSLDTALGVQHSFINMNLNDVICGGSYAYQYNGKTYHFSDPYGSYISQANAAGITISGQLMLRYPGKSYSYLLYGTKSATSKTGYYAMNAQNKKARETLEAAFSFLAERYSTEDCHLDNWILGNEVNIYPMWYYAGNTGKNEFMKNYADTYRILYYAVRSNYKNARVFICTDHTWINRCGDWGAKPFMDAFNSEIKSQNKNIKWNLAYHAYPAILTKSATWKDSHTKNSLDSDFVSPRNLDVMTNYVKKNFGSDTHILLSEQGFTSNSGQDVQAAAIAYTYYKAEFNPMIDAVIFRSIRDEASEVSQGLSFGLYTADGTEKPAYNVFKYMDTPQYAKYTKSCLQTIGISSWKNATSSFKESKLKKMPNR